MTEETDLDENRRRGPDESERESVINALMAHESDFERPPQPIDLGGVRWKPDLMTSNRVVHVELEEEIPRAFTRRLRAAKEAELKLTVATKAEALTFKTLTLLQELEASPVELQLKEDGGWAISQWGSVADWVARANMALRPNELRGLVAQRLEVAEDGDRTNHIRGHAYEEALCLLFSQVSWLKVVEHAYNNETEEIDIALLVTGAGEYAQLAGGPLAIATAKNEKKALGSATIKYLEGQMANRRGRCKLGFACSRGKISKAADIEIIGLRRAESVITPLDGAALEQLLEDADRLDERLAEMVIAAAMT